MIARRDPVTSRAPVISTALVRRAVLEEGFSLCGIARARVLSERSDCLQRYFDAGFEGEMRWLRRGWERRLDPSFIVPGARTVIVCAVNHKNEAWDQCAEPPLMANVVPRRPQGDVGALASTPRIASYIYARDYHVSVGEMLRGVIARVAAGSGSATGFRMRGVCDTAPILEKAWAVEAGLGWIGKNSLLITPQFGSFVSLGLLVTDAECDFYDSNGMFTTDSVAASPTFHYSPSTLHAQLHPLLSTHHSGCGSCTRCIDACPNGAIVAPRVIDARRCNAYLTLECSVGGGEIGEQHTCGGHVSVGRASEASRMHRALSEMPSTPLPQAAGKMQKHKRPPLAACSSPPNQLHTWIAGCDVCQSVCPHNRHTPLYSNPRFAPLMSAPMPATFWRELTRERFDEMLSGTVLARRGFEALATRIRQVLD